MRRCFQCGTKIDAAQLTAVADGEFCPACFRQLLAPGAAAAAAQTSSAQNAPTSSGSPSGLRPAAPAARATVPRAAAKVCLVCERDMRGEPALSFLGGDICAGCNAQMERELREAEPEAGPEASAMLAAPAGQPSSEPRGSQSSTSPSHLDPLVPLTPFTPGGQTRWCAGCERPMPGPGSYRVLAGEPYCAACVPFYSALDLGASPRHPKLDAAAGPPADGSSSAACDCCGAPLALGSGLHEGFGFCAKCLESDRALALSVARIRHRKKLEALRATFDPERKS